MTNFWEDDLDAFFGDFAVPASHNNSTFNVLFDNEYEQASPMDVGVEDRLPSILAKDSDITGIVQGSTITIGGTTYNVIRVEPDGTGISRVYLSED